MELDEGIAALFRDVVPVPADDGPNPLAPIAYPRDYSAAMDLFRACARANELSPRVLELTAAIIAINPAHYTVWKVRQDCLAAVSADLRHELEYATRIGLDNHKNYQVWHHREVVVSAILEDPTILADEDTLEKLFASEIAYLNEQMELDSKNYHAWSYRQWLVKRFNIWHRELADVNHLIDLDLRNNSAWNHRFFYFSYKPGGFTKDDVASEMDFSMTLIRKAPHNESSWNYLKGIVKTLPLDESRLELLEKEVRKIIAGNEFVVYAGAFLLAFLEGKISKETEVEQKKELQDEAKKLCNDLIKHDVIRMKYWNYRLTLLSAPPRSVVAP
ncbi:CAAX geranylgeranyltransferase alpha subunit [Entophlyctis luteolus]|nr:CAAX geranylgeranyltransferase alpha subunit [Entophlyctis luteolus]KAJ3392031.1 CAAX geranylgeranyltransferase alpha subunit [Entophlyctis sp. JEL0112]